MRQGAAETGEGTAIGDADVQTRSRDFAEDETSKVERSLKLSSAASSQAMRRGGVEAELYKCRHIVIAAAGAR